MGSLGPCSPLSRHGCNFTFLCVIADCLSLLLEVAFTVVCLGPGAGPGVVAGTKDTPCRCWLCEPRQRCSGPGLRALPNDALPRETKVHPEISKP